MKTRKNRPEHARIKENSHKKYRLRATKGWKSVQTGPKRETQEDPLTWTLAQRTEQRKSHFSRAIFAAFLAEPGPLFTVSA